MRGVLVVCSSMIALALACGPAQRAREPSWEQAIRPLYVRACTPCHSREGEAGLDLETSAAWKRRRADVRRCVVVDKTMPPNGHPFSEADREIVRAWLDGNE